MSTLAENVAKVVAAHKAIGDAISAKGVVVPEGTKLSGMGSLIEQIEDKPNFYSLSLYDRIGGKYTLPKKVVIDVPSLFSISYMFGKTHTLKSLVLPDGFGVKAYYANNCFDSCEYLEELSLTDGFGSNAIEIQSCFYYCTRLKSISGLNGFGNKAQRIQQCFQRCSNLTSLDLSHGFGVNATYANQVFTQCSNLVTLNLSEGFCGKATNINGILTGCSKLENITGGIYTNKSFALTTSPLLTHESLLNVLNALKTVATSTRLSIGATNLAKLTDEEKAIATSKGWTLA